jgi:hypothetical protein
MVTKWGLSDQLGPIAYGEEDDEVFLGRSVTQHKSVSNDTARRIDEEVRNILDEAYARTTELMTANLDKLHAMSQLLLQYETIDAPQIDAIMEGRDPPPPAGWNKSNKDGGNDKGGDAVRCRRSQARPNRTDGPLHVTPDEAGATRLRRFGPRPIPKNRTDAGACMSAPKPEPISTPPKWSSPPWSAWA